MNKPIFYQTELIEVKGNVLELVHPKAFRKEKGFLVREHPMTMTERMGNEEASCPECGENKWWLYPKESVAVRQGGKQYIECLNCGYQTHL